MKLQTPEQLHKAGCSLKELNAFAKNIEGFVKLFADEKSAESKKPAEKSARVLKETPCEGMRGKPAEEKKEEKVE